MEEVEEWEDWVRPAVCISIVVVAVFFFAFMYFGRSWMEGTARVNNIFNYFILIIISIYYLTVDIQKEPT